MDDDDFIEPDRWADPDFIRDEAEANTLDEPDLNREGDPAFNGAFNAW